MVTSLVLLYCVMATYASRRFSALCAAICAWCFFLYCTTELLSLVGLLSKPVIAASWLLSIVAWFVLLLVRRRQLSVSWGRLFSFGFPLAKLRSFSASKRIVVGLFSVFGIAIIVLAISTVPYNFDSMTYRLPRIMHWAQNGSVAHYSTNIERQVAFPPLAEFVNLHVFLITGSDRLFNLLQCLSFLFLAIAVYVIARRLGCEEKWAAVASVLVLSMPIGLSEAFNTQNDDFSAIWLIIFAYYSLDFTSSDFKFRLSRITCLRVILLGTCFAFGYLTKPSVCIGMCCFAAWILASCFWSKKERSRTFFALAICASWALLLIAPEAIRNLETFGGLITATGTRQLIGTIDPRYAVVNFAKNVIFNLPSSFTPGLNGAYVGLANRIASVFGVALDDAAISSGGLAFFVGNPYTFSHDVAINSVIVWLFLISTCAAVVMAACKRCCFNGYCACVLIAFVVYLSALRWEQFVTRYETAYLALLCPYVVWIAQNALSKRRAVSLVCVSVIVLLSVVMFADVYKYHYAKYADAANDRPSGYFAMNPGPVEGYQELTNQINSAGYSSVGLLLGEGSYEYPLWWMLSSEVDRIEHVGVTNDTLKHADESFVPECIICGIALDDDDIDVNGVHFEVVTESGGYRLLVPA